LRKAIAKLDGLAEGDVAVDYKAKTCTIRVQEGDPSAEAIMDAVNSASRFTLATN
jgi:hypothetical protein